MRIEYQRCKSCGERFIGGVVCPGCGGIPDERWKELKKLRDVAEQVDAAALKSASEKSAGSIPAIPTIKKPEPFKWYPAEKSLPARQKPVLVAYHPGGLGRPACRKFVIAVWGGDTWHFKLPHNVNYKPSRISHWMQISFPPGEKNKRKNASPEERQYYRYLDNQHKNTLFKGARGLPEGQENSTLPEAGSIPAERARRARNLA